MKKQFYACYDGNPFDVAIFGSKAERDQWVNYEDAYSKEFPEIKESPRIPLDSQEAYGFVGSKLYKRDKHFPDSVLENVRWVFRGNRPIGGILELEKEIN